MKKIIILILLLSIFIPSAAETITFGRYWQEDPDNLTPIEWIILDETEDSYLLLSKYCLDAHRFGSIINPCYWHNSDIRAFLNQDFYQIAFSKTEQRAILTTRLFTPRNYLYKNKGKDTYTNDKIFLLSIEEIEHYFPIPIARVAYSTFFAHNHIINGQWMGAAAYSDNAAYWWLRSNGGTEYYAAFINARGEIIYAGELAYAPHYSVRPALWVKKEIFDLQ